GNQGAGVLLDDSTLNLVQGNTIGLNGDGNPVGNGAEGVGITNGASFNTVGGTTAAARNVISANGVAGVVVADGTVGNVIAGNYIGTSTAGGAASAGGRPTGNGTDGVVVSLGATANTIGGTEPAARNVIAGNKRNGVFLAGVGTTQNLVQGNWIGLDAA